MCSVRDCFSYVTQQLGNQIGRGFFGIVHKGLNIDSGDFVVRMRRGHALDCSSAGVSCAVLSVKCLVWVCCCARRALSGYFCASSGALHDSDALGRRSRH